MRDRDDSPVKFHILKATVSSGLIFTNKTIEIGRTEDDDPNRSAYIEAALERMAGGSVCKKLNTN